MSDVLVGALTVLLATNPPNALSNLVQQKTGIAVPVVQTNDPVTRELEAIMAEDDQAQADIDRWIEEADKPDDPAAALAGVTLRGRIQQRIEPIKERYRSFLRAHPEMAERYGKLAFHRAAGRAWRYARRAAGLGWASKYTWLHLQSYFGPMGDPAAAPLSRRPPRCAPTDCGGHPESPAAPGARP